VVAGFSYVPDFLLAEEERQLVVHLEGEPFAPIPMRGRTTRRAIVSYGLEWKPLVGRLALAPAVPEYLHEVRARAAAIVGIDDHQLQQSLLTRYPAKSAIGWHVDHQSFGDVVLAISLLGDATLALRRDGEEHQLPIAARPLYVLRDAARATYQHRVTAKTLRYSITLRPVAGWRMFSLSKRMRLRFQESREGRDSLPSGLQTRTAGWKVRTESSSFHARRSASETRSAHRAIPCAVGHLPIKESGFRSRFVTMKAVGAVGCLASVDALLARSAGT
jgi:alkylated DNA repair dioxygenase AlkB